MMRGIKASTKVFCVIGHPIEHSMSPSMHNIAFQALGLDNVYVAFDILPEYLANAISGIKALDIKGFNVTLPHKRAMLKYLDQIDPLAGAIGAINTVKNDDGLLIGKNTDAMGGEEALIQAGGDLTGKRVMILGAGGAARAISYVLAGQIAHLVILNRTQEKAVILAREVQEKANIKVQGKGLDRSHLLEEINRADILINTTSVGMYPNINVSPVPKELLHDNLLVFDVIYNPIETQLLKDAIDSGCKVLNGVDMLVNQGALAFEWWTDKKPNKRLMKSEIIKLLEEKKC
jgi:shikimate dehydrogenase